MRSLLGDVLVVSSADGQMSRVADQNTTAPRASTGSRFVRVENPALALGAVMTLMFCVGCDSPPATPRNNPTKVVPSESRRTSENSPADQVPDTPTFEPQVDTTPQPVYRPEDVRPVHDAERLRAAGVNTFTSQRLRLHTDLPAETAQSLPGLIDQVYDAWEAYFGPMPPDRSGTDFQITGYLMKDDRLFRELGLLPENLPSFEHGRHRRNEFWMRDQPYDYYRRHLVLHEATHCFMTYLADQIDPVWYLEGMAELFASHRLDENGRLTLRVMPTAPETFLGFGRITLIREAFARNESRSIDQVLALIGAEFREPLPYAWSWALCAFLDGHPRYRERFRQLGQYTDSRRFAEEFLRVFRPDARDLETEWALFIVNLQYGYDVERAAIEFRPGLPLQPTTSNVALEVRGDRGWQSTGVLLEAGRHYVVATTGKVTLAALPKPWVSEPQGVSIRYSDGKPIGQLLACLRTEAGTIGGDRESMTRVLSVGRGRIIQAPVTGTLYLRINDFWNELADNTGSYRVQVSGRNAP